MKTLNTSNKKLYKPINKIHRANDITNPADNFVSDIHIT